MSKYGTLVMSLIASICRMSLCRNLKTFSIYIFVLVIIGFNPLFASHSNADEIITKSRNFQQLDSSHLALLPVQHQGRIKPLDSFARNHLKIFSHRNNLGKLDAMEWMTEVIFAPEISYGRPLFKIRNLHGILELPPQEDNLYSFYQVSTALGKQQQLVQELRESDYEQLTINQQELVDLSDNSLAFFDISRSLSLFALIFKIQDEQLASYLGVPQDISFNYLDAVKLNNRLTRFIEDTLQSKQEAKIDDPSASTDFTATEIEALAFANLLNTISNDKKSLLMKVLPKQWSGSWTSPWENIDLGDGSPDIAKLFAKWQKLILTYNDEDWADTSQHLLDDTLAISGVPLWRLKIELFYNESRPFFIGMLLYILATFMAIMAAIINSLLNRTARTKKGLFSSGILFSSSRKVILALIGGGIAAQLTGIGLRMLILNRPPVSNFHESLLFVMVIVVLGGFTLELIKRNYWGIVVACTSGIILSLLGFYYQGQGDSMQMLIAVLNTNYWLATHVIVITLGYAASIITAILAHTYLAKYAYHRYKFGISAKNANGDKWSDLYNYMLGGSLIALFLMLLGTLLGGIWADQSWGRFWGWDPKENGALLIILWLILMIHARITSSVTPHIFAAGLVVLNPVVALSWFGVNLLNVGLHSYGFIDNNALFGLFGFIGLEFAYITATLLCGMRHKWQTPRIGESQQ